MRTLSFYLLREVLATLTMTVAVFTFVLLLGNVLKEILTLLVGGQVSLRVVLLAIALLIPYVLVFALPMGLLTSMLIVFGRLSADHELTAIRASGVSLISLSLPVLVLALVLSGLSAAVTMEVSPSCRVAYKALLYDVGVDKVATALQEKTFIQDFPGLMVYADQVDGQDLKGVQLYKLDDDGKYLWYIRAERGHLYLDQTNQTMTVSLKDCWYLDLGKGSGPIYNAEAEYSTNLVDAPRQKVKVSDMTFRELRAHLREIEGRFDESVRQASAEGADPKWVGQILEEKTEATMPLKMNIHRQVSFSFACIAFTLLGIPLGIKAHRKETTFGIFVALVLVLIYYSFFILGGSLKNHPHLHPYLLLWAPNVLFQVIGGILIWRSNRGG